jgi:hypothetical protein
MKRFNIHHMNKFSEHKHNNVHTLRSYLKTYYLNFVKIVFL